MKNENKIFIVIIISILIIATFIFFSFEFSGKAIESFENKKFITKIIDGDTVVAEGENVRLLGIDADERSYPCYNVAKERLEELILNKEVILEKDQTDKDQYKRYLRYIFINGKNINLQLVKEGLAVARFYPEDVKYKGVIVAAEKEARENKIGCKWGEEEQPKQEEEQPSQDGEWNKLTNEKTGLDVIGACNAGNYFNKEKIVEGKIVDTYRSKTNTIFLNFEKPYPNQCFNAVIFSSDIYKFPEDPEDYYYRKTVRIMGEIEEYEGKPEIILKNLNQIEIEK